jgi:acylphosphatase
MHGLHSISILIRGKVQGVWFRASAQKVAMELGLSGFVANEKDGAVYIEATGHPEALNQFLTWCHEGPQLARVDSVEVQKINLIHHGEFVVRR